MISTDPLPAAPVVPGPPEDVSTPRALYRETGRVRAYEPGVLRLIADGDREAFRALVADVGPHALSLAQRITGNRQLAEDALQEALVDVWTKAGRFDAARGGVRQWVLTVVHHKAVDAVRRERAASRTSSVVPVPEPTDDPEESGLAADRRARVRRALNGLAREQREAIELAYLGGLTYREVAHRLGIPEGTAKSRLRAGLRALRGLLEANGVVWGQP
jgi:RNA polymerase sigma-70 factor (ECF subfamily)